MAKRLLLGLSLHVKHDDDPGNDSLPGVAATLSDPRFDDLDKLFDYLRDYAHDPSHSRGWIDAEGQATATHPLVAQVATQMLAMEERVKANIVAETQSFLTLYSDPVIAANISSSDFDLAELARRPHQSLPCSTAGAQEAAAHAHALDPHANHACADGYTRTRH